MHDSLRAMVLIKQLMLGNHNGIHTLIGVSGATIVGFFGSTTATVNSHTRRYIPYGCRSFANHFLLKSKNSQCCIMWNIYEWSNIYALLFVSATQPSDDASGVELSFHRVAHDGSRSANPTRGQVSSLPRPSEDLRIYNGLFQD